MFFEVAIDAVGASDEAYHRIAPARNMHALWVNDNRQGQTNFSDSRGNFQLLARYSQLLVIHNNVVILER